MTTPDTRPDGWNFDMDQAPKDASPLLLWDGFSVFEGLWNGQWCAASLSPRPWTKAWRLLPAPPKGGESNG
jgi:hypothetical protein